MDIYWTIVEELVSLYYCQLLEERLELPRSFMETIKEHYEQMYTVHLSDTVSILFQFSF